MASAGHAGAKEEGLRGAETLFTVGVLGAYSKTKETVRQVHSLLEKARAERSDREPTTTKVRTPKELPDEVQQAILDGYRSGASMKELARVLGVHRTTVRAALDRHGDARGFMPSRKRKLQRPPGSTCPGCR